MSRDINFEELPISIRESFNNTLFQVIGFILYQRKYRVPEIENSLLSEINRHLKSPLFQQTKWRKVPSFSLSPETFTEIIQKTILMFQEKVISAQEKEVYDTLIHQLNETEKDFPDWLAFQRELIYLKEKAKFFISADLDLLKTISSLYQSIHKHPLPDKKYTQAEAEKILIELNGNIV